MPGGMPIDHLGDRLGPGCQNVIKFKTSSQYFCYQQASSVIRKHIVIENKLCHRITLYRRDVVIVTLPIRARVMFSTRCYNGCQLVSRLIQSSVCLFFRCDCSSTLPLPTPCHTGVPWKGPRICLHSPRQLNFLNFAELVVRPNWAQILLGKAYYLHFQATPPDIKGFQGVSSLIGNKTEQLMLLIQSLTEKLCTRGYKMTLRGKSLFIDFQP